MLSTRINTRLSSSLAGFVEQMVEYSGLYETPSEYIRDLIRKDMERRDVQAIQGKILQGFRDVKAGRVVKSTGDFLEDIKLYRAKKASRKK